MSERTFTRVGRARSIGKSRSRAPFCLTDAKSARRSGADKGRSADGAEATHPDIDRKRRPLPRCREHAALGRVESRLDRVWVAFGRYGRTHCRDRAIWIRPPRRARSFSRTRDRTPWPTRPSCRRRSPARGGGRRARRGGSRARGRRGRRRKRRAPSCQSAESAGASERSSCQATWLVLDINPSVSLPFRRAFLRSALPRRTSLFVFLWFTVM